MKHFFFAAKKIAVTVIAAVGLLSAQLISTSPAYAEKAPTVILIVDMNALFSASEVGLDVARQLQEQAQALQTEDEAVRQSLSAEADTLKAQQADLAADEFAAKVSDLAQRQQVHLQSIGVRQQALQLGHAQANAEIANVLKAIFGELLVKHNAGLLIDQSNVLAGGLDLNITPEVLALLNQRLSSVTVTPVDPATLANNR
jgi:Skp family chaperone for outer membrane proteins